MKKSEKKSASGPAKNGLLQLLVFVVLIGLTAIICRLLTMNDSFSFVKTIYQGNGIYNAFFNDLETDDLDVPAAVTEAETQLPPFEYDSVFGKPEYSPIAVLMSMDGTVVLDIDKDRVFFPASITKVMTAIVAYENIPDLSVMITLDQSIFDICDEENAATAGYLAGEQASALDLLYGTLLTSGADAAIALADYVAGSEEEFAVLMNQKAAEYGLTNTNFVNCTGLHNTKHYSTAYELAIIMSHALEIDLLREIMSSYSYRSTTATLHETGLVLVSTVGKAFTKAGLEMGNVLGGKTGFTDDALLCLASFADMVIDGQTETFILVTLGAGDGSYDTPYHVYDANLVFNSVVSETDTEAATETEAETAANG